MNSTCFYESLEFRNLATDNVNKLPLTKREGLPPLISDVVNQKGIVIGYSNDLGMEVNINCTFPNGERMVEMVHSTEVTAPFQSGWLINKFFPGREQLKWKMAALFESGIFSHLEYKEYAEFRERNPQKENEFLDTTKIKSLTLEDIQGTLALLFSGFLISFLVFILEIIVGDPTKKENPSQNYNNANCYNYKVK